MSSGRDKKPVLALIVYAKRNVRDMAERAFRSIARQERKPDKLLVVDDDSEAGFDDVKERVLDLRLDNCHVQVLRNERTPGLCGAMNTAVLKLMEYAEEERYYVSFLREEDELRPDHFRLLESATAACSNAVVLTDVIVKGKAKPIRMSRSDKPKTHLRTLYGLDLDLASCLMGAFAVRLDALLEAGTFNEALRGMQIHELLLRLAELPERTWGSTGQRTLVAPPSGYQKYQRTDGVLLDRRQELTSSVILDMRRGSRTFCLLAKNRLDQATQHALNQSIKRRIQKRDKRTSLKRWGIGYDLTPASCRKVGIEPLSKSARQALAACRIVVGIISRGNLLEENSGLPRLLRELGSLAKHLGHIQVLVLDNASDVEPSHDWFTGLVCNTDKFKVQVIKGCFPVADSTAKGFQASIARARQEIQSQVASHIRTTPKEGRALAWFVDEDLSLVNRAMCWDDEECLRWFVGQLASLLEDISKGARASVAMTLGQVTDAPPVPGTMTFRLQLLDAVTALRSLRAAPPEGNYKYRDFQRVLEKWISPGREIRDFYYDVSSRDLVHLEFPFDYFPWDNGEFSTHRLSNRDVLREVVGKIPKLAKGKQVFRPIFADRHFAVDPSEMHEDGFPPKVRRPKITHVPSVLRGGNTLMPSGKDSNKYPTVTLRGFKYRGKPFTPRRADMVSAVICRYLHGKEVTACSLPVRQCREDEGNKHPRDLLNPGKFEPDTEGFAIYSALKTILDERQLARLDTKIGKKAREKCDFRPRDFDQFLRAITEFRKIRKRAIIASFYRVRGLAKMLERELILVKPLMADPQGRDLVRKALVFSRGLVGALRPGFDREPGIGAGRAKILSTKKSAVRYSESDVKLFLNGLRKHART
jgi:hypothetical protein